MLEGRKQHMLPVAVLLQDPLSRPAGRCVPGSLKVYYAEAPALALLDFGDQEWK